jgi:hypothetical protein
MRPLIPDPQSAWTEDEARRLLESWQRSGDTLTLAAFARKVGVGASRRYYWKNRLGSPTTTERPAFSLIPAAVVTTSTEPMIAIRLPGGIELDVANASPSWIAAMVAELARSAS